MRQNTGEAFFHPVTHQFIQKNGFYQGAAHVDNEDVEDVQEDSEGAKESGKTSKGKSNKTAEENK
jgi:hypothetical protein